MTQFAFISKQIQSHNSLSSLDRQLQLHTCQYHYHYCYYCIYSSHQHLLFQQIYKQHSLLLYMWIFCVLFSVLLLSFLCILCILHKFEYNGYTTQIYTFMNIINKINIHLFVSLFYKDVQINYHRNQIIKMFFFQCNEIIDKH